MSKKQLNLVYALKDNEIVSVDDVESGLKCGCICPACGAPLVAKKGSKMMHHFSHYAGQNCEYGYETSLHLAAKSILLHSKEIIIPPVYIEFPNDIKKKELINETQKIIIDRVELEKHFDNIIPDVVVYSGKKKFFIEIFVTHKIDEQKLKKLKDANISTIEIDLSKKKTTISTEELTKLLLQESDEKKWKYNTKADKYLNRFIKASDKYKIISRGYAFHIDNCPIKARVWRGKPYANFIDDCTNCKYYIYSTQKYLFCTGRLRLGKIGDFKIPYEQRIKESNDEIETLREMAFAGGTCPNCGCRLVKRQSDYGEFWGCSNYPHCRFVASKDTKTGKIKMKA